MDRRFCLAAALVLAATTAFAQTAKPPSIQGAWRVAEVVTTGANAVNNAKPFPGFYIFTSRHYSIVMITSTTPRPAFTIKDAAKPTDAEKIAAYAQWDPLTANSGTYEIKGNTVITRPIVAKNETVMAGPVATREFKLEGNTLWLTTRSAAGQPVSETRTRLTRVE